MDASLRLDALSRWLDDHAFPGAGSPLQTKAIGAGTQNLIVEVRRSTYRWVLRMPPARAPADRDRGIAREWRLMRALAPMGVPLPRALGLCQDHSVCGRPFIVMSHVEGWTLTDVDRPRGSGVPWVPRDLADAMVDALASLDRVPAGAPALQGIGRPDGFHERQVDRWSSMLRECGGRAFEGAESVARWLRARRPIDFIPGVQHGDFHAGNLMFSRVRPTVESIVDWEMATVGDPKLDLATLLHDWPDDRVPGSGPDFVDLSDMPPVRYMLDRYVAATGRQADDIDYYFVLQKWKLAIVLERGFQRARGDPRLEELGRRAERLMAEAVALAARSAYSIPAGG